MECPPRPPSPSGSGVQEEAAAAPTTPVLVTSDGHLVFPLPLVQGLNALSLPTTVPTPTPTSTPTPPRPITPITTPTPSATPPRPTTPRRPTPRRPAPQPPTRPAPPTTPLPQVPTPTPPPDNDATPTATRSTTPASDRSLSTTPVPDLALMNTPVPEVSLSNTCTPRGVSVGRLSLRLIDDETDTDEDSRCDSFDDHIVFPPRPVVAPTRPVITPARLTLTRPTPLMPTPAHPPRPPPPPEAQWWDGAGRAPRGLAHSASDPGVRRPRLWVPPAAPLAEEEGEVPAAPRLVRSDSVVTVPEDLLAPRPSLAGVAAAALVGAALMPGTAMLLHAAFRLVFGTLFPAYYSYKAVKTKNVKEYVKWMMYWIVFAFFTCLETLTDIFLSFWFPFYYELKILVVLWLLSPATRGSSILYRKFVHPWLTRREEDIDNCIAQAKQQGYSAVLSLGSKGVNYATTVIMQTAIKGGGGIMNQLRRSYSSGELIVDDGDMNRNIKPLPPHLQDQGYDDPPHHRAGPPGTPPTPHYPSVTPPSPHYVSHTPPSPYYTSASPVAPHYTPPSPLLAGVDLDGPPSPPLTRQRLRQQQQRKRWVEEGIVEEEREEEVDYGGY